jgi:hypothetical protein
MLQVCARDPFGFAQGRLFTSSEGRLRVGGRRRGDEIFATLRLHSYLELYRLNAGAALCSATIFFAFSARALA